MRSSRPSPPPGCSANENLLAVPGPETCSTSSLDESPFSVVSAVDVPSAPVLAATVSEA